MRIDGKKSDGESDPGDAAAGDGAHFSQRRSFRVPELVKRLDWSPPSLSEWPGVRGTRTRRHGQEVERGEFVVKSESGKMYAGRSRDGSKEVYVG